jgi:predicted ArsR family transcriptional regulator
MSNFPPLRLAVLTGLIGLKSQLDTLENPDCPYDDETKLALAELLAPKVIEKIVEKEVQVESKNGRGRPTKDIRLSAEDEQLVLDEIRATIKSLNDLDATDGMDVREKLALLKTKGDQLERMLKLAERHTTVQKMGEFQEQVIKILDDLVSEADREQFMKRLEPYR